MRFLFVLSFYVIVLVGQVNAQKVWKEAGGILIVEVEEMENPPFNDRQWSLEDSIEGFKGSGYLRWKGRPTWRQNNYDSLAIIPEGRLHYWIDIQNPGDYYIHVRNYHALEDGDNDVWIGLNRSDYGKYYDHDEHVWSYCETGIDKENNRLHKDWAVVNLKKGLNRLYLYGRSPDFCVDRVILVKTDIPESIWSDASLPQSETDQR